MHRSLRNLVVLVSVGAVVAMGTGGVASGQSGPTPGKAPAPAAHVGKGDKDTRPGARGPSAAQRTLAKQAVGSVTWNDFGTPQRVSATRGAPLASGLSSDPESAAREYLAAQRETFGLTSDSVSALRTVSVNRIGDGAAVLLRQQFGDLPAGFDGLVSVGVVDGSVVSLTSTLARDVSAPAPATLSQRDALAAAVRDAGLTVGAISAAGESHGWNLFTVKGLSGTQGIKQVAVPMPAGGARASYEVAVTDETPANPASYTTYVDGRNGDVLVREDNVDEENDNPTWQAFPANPPANYSSTDTRETWCWTATAGCDRVVGNPSSPLQWDIDPLLSSTESTHTTRGNNEYAAEAWLNATGNGFNMAGFATPSPTRDYQYPWTNQWFEQSCSPDVFDSPARNDIDAADANLHAMHNRMHDFSYKLGFTESAWNSQVDNFGNGGLGNDPEQGNAQSGARVTTSLIRDNANQATPADGLKPTTNMFLWQPIAGAFYSPCVDGDYDMSVIGHEYTHMISNRMVAGPDRRLSGFQAGAMGESWSDLNGTEYLVEYGLVPADQDPYVTGQYVTGNAEVGIRDYAISRNPLNYSDVGFDLTGPEVHADGEIWNAINYAVREAFVKKYGEGSATLKASCADGTTPLADCPGGRRWIQLVYDAWLLMAQGNVSMVDARDAMIAADQLRFHGANNALLWDAFAGRGLGEGASSNTNADTDPTPSFASPRSDNVKLRFQPSSGATNVRIFVGDYQARAVPVADTDPTTPLPDTASFVPGRYSFVAQAPGFGATRFSVKADDPKASGKARSVPVEMARNLASSASGAVATGDGVNQAKLIDDDEGSNWAVLGQAQEPVAGKAVTVDLAGSKPVRVGRVQVSALLRPASPADPGGDTGSQNRFTALRQFRVLACTVSQQVACDDAGDFTPAYTSPADAFPSEIPRPVAPTLTLRSFPIPSVVATHLRFEVVSSQCTGNPQYAGQQSADPNVPTDCSTAAAGSGQVRASEFQAFAK